MQTTQYLPNTPGGDGPFWWFSIYPTSTTHTLMHECTCWYPNMVVALFFAELQNRRYEHQSWTWNNNVTMLLAFFKLQKSWSGECFFVDYKRLATLFVEKHVICKTIPPIPTNKNCIVYYCFQLRLQLQLHLQLLLFTKKNINRFKWKLVTFVILV